MLSNPNDEAFRQRVASKIGACTCANIRRASRVVTRIYDAALQPAGLKVTQFTLLATLLVTGSTTLTNMAGALGQERLSGFLNDLSAVVQIGQEG